MVNQTIEQLFGILLRIFKNHTDELTPSESTKLLAAITAHTTNLHDASKDEAIRLTGHSQFFQVLQDAKYVAFFCIKRLVDIMYRKHTDGYLGVYTKHRNKQFWHMYYKRNNMVLVDVACTFEDKSLKSKTCGAYQYNSRFGKVQQLDNASVLLEFGPRMCERHIEYCKFVDGMSSLELSSRRGMKGECMWFDLAPSTGAAGLPQQKNNVGYVALEFPNEESFITYRDDDLYGYLQDIGIHYHACTWIFSYMYGDELANYKRYYMPAVKIAKFEKMEQMYCKAINALRVEELYYNDQRQTIRYKAARDAYKEHLLKAGKPLPIMTPTAALGKEPEINHKPLNINRKRKAIKDITSKAAKKCKVL